jgi:hypothetical protein
MFSLVSVLFSYSTSLNNSEFCYGKFENLSRVIISDLNDSDLEDAYKNILPELRKKCSLFLEFDEYEFSINNEVETRNRDL